MQISTTILRILKRKKPVILAGDLNVAHTELDLYDTKNKEKVPGYTPEER
jgi:exodeoxyribonuclease-3